MELQKSHASSFMWHYKDINFRIAKSVKFVMYSEKYIRVGVQLLHILSRRAIACDIISVSTTKVPKQ
jgi:hypothetical protein